MIRTAGTVDGGNAIAIGGGEEGGSVPRGGTGGSGEALEALVEGGKEEVRAGCHIVECGFDEGARPCEHAHKKAARKTRVDVVAAR